MKAVGFPFDRGRLDESEHPFTEGGPGRHPHHHALRPRRRVLRPARRAARDRARHVRPRPAAGLARPAGRPRPRHGARGEPVAAHGDDRLPQPPVRALPAAAAREALRRRRPGMGRRERLRPPDARAARPDPRRRRRAHLPAAHHAALRAREAAAVAGELAVRDLPEAWNAGMEQRLGIRPPNDVDGCLQDIHWAVGSFGYFPSYALGAVIAAQLYESLRAEVPGARRAARARGVRRPVRLAAHPRARPRRQGAGAGAAQERHRQAAVGHLLHPLCRGKVPREHAPAAPLPEGL